MLLKYLDDYEIGIDEAGRGPLLGRVYAGAVIWNQNIKVYPPIKDSKKLSSKKRAEYCEWIKLNALAWGVGWADIDEIDLLNINNATKLAMDRAIINLKLKSTKLDKPLNNLIIDGIGWENKFNGYNVKSIIKGDNIYLSIASASILAKEFHDDYIKDLCLNDISLNEKYDILKNKGYGTKKHLDGLKKYGNSLYHRLSYKPCCNIINCL
jgi:ribonuclease HII